MPKVKQPNSSKVRSILHEYASEFTSTPKGELFSKFYDCLVKSDKRLWWKHIATAQSINEVRFMKLKVARHF